MVQQILEGAAGNRDRSKEIETRWVYVTRDLEENVTKP